MGLKIETSQRLLVGGVLFALIAGCAEARTDVVTADQIWDDEVTTSVADFPVTFAERSASRSYGLPAAGDDGMQDLFDEVFAGLTTRTNFVFAQSIFDRAEDPLQQCRSNGAVASASLPMVIEGVVTHHPRRFMKVEMCAAEEDERNWGVFTVEDDTGGIVVLRGGRTANFSFGDRVRLTVYGAQLTFSQDPDTRVVSSYDLEVLTPPSADQAEPVLYARTSAGFDAGSIGRVLKVEGFVTQSPSNANFNEMIVADLPIPTGTLYPANPPRSLSDCVVLCERACGSDDCTGAAATASCGGVCEATCLENDGTFPDDTAFPSACWSVSLDIDLGRRGYTLPVGTEISAVGPVVSSFGRVMWIYTPAQIEVLSEVTDIASVADD